MSELRQRHTGAGALAAEPDRAAAPDAPEEDQPARCEGRDGSSGSTLRVGLVALACVRVAAAILTMIADCDETFNYWEPMHFITFGRGFQTWEYSPEYALRSYLFLLPHAAVAKFAAVMVGRPGAFYLTRAAQACAAIASEGALVLAVRHRFGAPMACNLVLLLLTSPGLWTASVAFLPSSIAMLLVCVVWACWMTGRFAVAILLGMATVVVVWPFTGLMFVPLGLHALVAWKPVPAILVAFTSCVLWTLTSLIVDSSFYGRTVVPALEILRYNVLSKHATGGGGSELYGVEPWYFYLLNGTLNLTLALPAAMSLPVVATLGRCCSDSRSLSALGYSCSGFLWLLFFSGIPHKEERFLAPAYPVLLFAAAASVEGVCAALSAAAKKLGRHTNPILRLVKLLRVLFLLLVVLLSTSRIVAVQTGYAAPLQIYGALSTELRASRAAAQKATPMHVCIGLEWYRFTTSFFLPHEEDHLSYVRFGPTGLLPAEWNATLGTSQVPPNMNDRNEEEVSRYIEPALCDYLIDLDVRRGSMEGDIPQMLSTGAWEVVAQASFLDAALSRQPWRSFYVPGISSRRNIYAEYRLWKKTS